MPEDKDPVRLIDGAPMSRFQMGVVALCICLYALDGFDVLSISFAAPGIADEWSINRAELGVVLAMELVGMAFGSIAFGGLADRFGRRPTIQVCLVVMTAGMYLASIAGSLNQLLVVRLVTGLGIGGMLATTNAIAAEYSNRRHQNLSVILMAAGYPLGVTLGGTAASFLLQSGDWRVVFEFGALITGAFFPVVWFFLPETIPHLMKRRDNPRSLERINRTLHRMGHDALAALPELAVEERRLKYGALFSSQFRMLTALLCVGYFCHIMTFYFVLKWIPKVVVDMGYEPALAGSVLVTANIGGMVGALLLGLAASRFGLRHLLMAVLVLSFLLVSAFGWVGDDLSSLMVIAAAVGFFINGGVVGFYALIAAAFPADVRAGGTGIVIGVGRGGAVLGPLLAGLLLNGGAGLPLTAFMMGVGALLAAITVFLLRPVLQRHKIAASI